VNIVTSGHVSLRLAHHTNMITFSSGEDVNENEYLLMSGESNNSGVITTNTSAAAAAMMSSASGGGHTHSDGFGGDMVDDNLSGNTGSSHEMNRSASYHEQLVIFSRELYKVVEKIYASYNAEEAQKQRASVFELVRQGEQGDHEMITQRLEQIIQEKRELEQWKDHTTKEEQWKQRKEIQQKEEQKNKRELEEKRKREEREQKKLKEEQSKQEALKVKERLEAITKSVGASKPTSTAGASSATGIVPPPSTSWSQRLNKGKAEADVKNKATGQAGKTVGQKAMPQVVQAAAAAAKLVKELEEGKTNIDADQLNQITEEYRISLRKQQREEEKGQRKAFDYMIRSERKFLLPKYEKLIDNEKKLVKKIRKYCTNKESKRIKKNMSMISN